MKRKVIQLAGTTLVVSLPSRWAKANHIAKGAEIDVDEKGDQLVIGGRQQSAAATEVDLSGTLPMTKRVLGAVFKAGYDEVLVRFSIPDELAAAQDVIRSEFIGFEIVSRTKNTLRVKSITTLDTAAFETMLRRLFLTVIGMADESIGALHAADALWLQSIMMTDKDVNKYADYCRRMLNRHSFSISNRPTATYYVAEQLERLGDIYRDICSAAAQGAKLSETKLYADVAGFLRRLYECYYDFSLEKMAVIGKKREELRKKIVAAETTAAKQELPILILLDKAVDDIFDMNGVTMAERI